MSITSIHRVLMSALDNHLTAPWRWPRESDLVPDLVSELRAAMPPTVLGSTLRLPRNMIDIGATSPRTSPRVRTEIRVPRPVPRARKPGQRQTHLERIDIGVFRRDCVVTTTLERNGARDVVLEVKADDLVALLEIKVYPDTYVDGHQRCLWFEDVTKLAPLASCLRGVLFIDTALPLSTIGIVPRNPSAAQRRSTCCPQPWPLRDQPFTAGGMRFTPAATVRDGGLYLWALAVRDGSAWDPAGVRPGGGTPSVDTADVTPHCWEIEKV